MTKTRERHEFLGKRLKEGMSRPEAARTMVKSELGKKKDGTRIKESTAITMVYQGYSGERFAIENSDVPKKKSATTTKKKPISVKKKTSGKKTVTAKPSVKPKTSKQEVVKKGKTPTKAKRKSSKEPIKAAPKPRKKGIEEGTELVF